MKLNFNFEKTVGKIKPMHAVGQPPFFRGVEGVGDQMFHYLTEANIPYSRLHDVGGWFGGNLFVDIPNIFRDFDADENNPESYDFTFTDLLLTKLVAAGVEPYFRLGVTIENAHKVKAYRIYPPADNQKWARICEHIIRHYNYGWANGFQLGITYWEIWNEPDCHEDPAESDMFKGTAEQYYDLYAAAATHLKACFGDSIKVGGYASSGIYRGFMDVDEEYTRPHEITLFETRAFYHTKFFKGFLERVKRDNLPIDFFSHHSYVNVPRTILTQRYVEKFLEEAGLGHIEIHLNEWNRNRDWKMVAASKTAAESAAMMLAMHETKVSMMCYYDARIGIGPYAGFFNGVTREPFATYYVFKAFGKLYALGDQVEITGDLGDDLYAMAAANGKERGILITNIGEDKEIETNLGRGYAAYLINEKNHMVKKRISVKNFKLKQYDTLFIEKV